MHIKKWSNVDGEEQPKKKKDITGSNGTVKVEDVKRSFRWSEKSSAQRSTGNYKLSS